MSAPRSLRRLLGQANGEMTFEAFLEGADKVDPSSANDLKLVEKFARVFLKQFEKHLKARRGEWYDLGKRELAYVVSQLEAIAYLTGLKSELFDSDEFPLIRKFFKLPDLDSYVVENFLHHPERLKGDYNRALLTMQLLVRVADYTKIHQGDEQVCGPAAFIYCVASNNAMTYVEYVVNLAQTGVSEMAMAGDQGLPVYVESNTLRKRPDEGIQEADFLALVALRVANNRVFDYSPGGRAFGVTMPAEMRNWLSKVGFAHVNEFPLATKEDVKRCEKLLGYGYSAIQLTTTQAAAHIRDGELPDSVPSPLRQRLDGHFVQISAISYLDASDEVELEIVTWGQKTERIKISLNDLVGMSGASKIVVGQSPQAERKLLSSARYHTNEHRIHPYFYLNQIEKLYIGGDPARIKSFSESDQAFVKELEAFVKSNKTSLAFDSWTLAAKALQERIYQRFMANNGVEPFHSWLVECLEYSIVDEETVIVEMETEDKIKYKETVLPSNIKLKKLLAPEVSSTGNDPVSLSRLSFVKLNLPLLAKHGYTLQEIEYELGEVVRLKDIDGVCLLIECYIHQGKYQEARRLLDYARRAEWLNSYDKHVCEQSFVLALRNKMYDFLLAESQPSESELTSLLMCQEFIHETRFKQDFQAVMGLLVHQFPSAFSSKARGVKQVAELDDNAQTFVSAAEECRLYLYHLQILLMALNDLNNRLYPNKYLVREINGWKKNLNKCIEEFISCIEKDNCLLDNQSLIGCLSKVKGLQANILKPQIFNVREDKKLPEQLAGLTRDILVRFNGAAKKQERPAIKSRNTNSSPLEESNINLFRNNSLLDAVQFNIVVGVCGAKKDIQGRVVGMMAGAIAGVFAGIMIPAFAILLTTLPVVGIIVGAMVLLGLAGYAIGNFIDTKIQQSSPLVQKKESVTLSQDNIVKEVVLKNTEIYVTRPKNKEEFPSLNNSSSLFNPAQAAAQNNEAGINLSKPTCSSTSPSSEC